jgi:hypothetical protein
MSKETTMAILAIIVVGGAVASAFIAQEASQVLVPVATFILGFYFKQPAMEFMAKLKKKYQ